MRLGLVAAVVAALVLLLTACGQQPTRETIGTGVGAVAGGAIGSQVGNGTAATIVGGVIGAVVGREIGRHLDERDRQQVYSALEEDTTTTWHNPETDTRYTFEPTRTFQDEQGRVCRDYTTDIEVEGRQEVATGTACRRADGTWETIS
jgi:surface antigen